MTTLHRIGLLFSMTLAVGCGGGRSIRDNPYDAKAPAAKQLKGEIKGSVIADAAFDPATLTLSADGVASGGGAGEAGDIIATPNGQVVDFSIPVVAGTYSVRASAPGFDLAERYGIIVSPGETVEIGYLTLKVGRGGMQGHILARSPTAGDVSAPLDTKVTLIRLVEPLTASTTGSDCEEPGAEEMVIAPLKADGTFSALGLAAGPYIVVAERDGYVPALTGSSVDVQVNQVADAGDLVLLVGQGVLRITTAVDPEAAPGTAVTRNYDVTLDLSRPPLYNGMRLSEDLTFSDPLSGDTDFGATQESLPWIFSAGEGERELFVQFRAPTCRVSPLFSATVVFDTTAPIAEPVTLSTGKSCTNVPLVSLKLAANDPCTTDVCAGLYRMRLSTDGVLDDEPWTDYDAQKPLDLGGDGEVSLVFAVEDRAGNASASVSSMVTVNSTGPVVASPAFLVDGGVSSVHSLNIDLSFNVTGATDVEVGNAPGLDGTRWMALPVTMMMPWRLTEGPDGPRQVVVRFRDDCGNVTQEFSMVLGLDRTGRIGGSVQLEGTAVASGTGISVWHFDTGSATYVDTGKTTTTGTSGAFLVTGLLGGTYQLKLTHLGYKSRIISDIAVTEGGGALVPEVTLAMARGDLAGKATLSGEDSFDGILVQAAAGVVTFTDVDGKYLFSDLPVGQYLVSAEAGAAYYKTAASGLTTVLEDQAVQAPDIVLLPVPGTVQGHAERFGVSARDGIDVLLRGITVGGTEKSAATTTDSQGDFSLTDLTAGTYGISISSTGFRSVTQSGLVLSPNETLVTDPVVLQPATGTVNGPVALSGQSNYGGVRISLQQSSVERGFTYSDSLGNYSFASVAAGTYSLSLSMTGFSTGHVSPVVVIADQPTNVGLVTLSPQIGDIHLKNIVTATSVTTVEVTGTYPGGTQGRFCERPGVTDPASFVAGDCDYENLVFAAGQVTRSVSFVSSHCPNPGDPVAVCDGAKTVWVRIKDGGGVESNWFELPVILDRKAPRGNVVIEPTDNTLSGGNVVVDGGEYYTRLSAAAVLVVAEEDLSGIAVGDATAGVVTAKLYRTPTDSNPVVVATTGGVSHLQGVSLSAGGDGPRHLYLVVEDAAGNKSVTNLATVSCPDPRLPGVPTDCDSIFLDTTAPQTIKLSINPVDPTGDYSVGAVYASSPLVSIGIDTTVTGLAEDEGVEAIVANDSGFITALVQPLAQPKTLLSWALSAGEGTKTVYVKVRDQAGNLSTAFTDTIILDTVAPDAPVPSPMAAYTNNARPTLAFGAVDGADKYRLQLSDASAFDGSGVVNTDIEITSSAYTPAVNLPDGRYYWRVRSLDNAGHQSAFSPVVSFVVDTVLPAAPVLQALSTPTRNNRPTFTWSSISDATGYQIQIDTALAFNTGALVTGNTGATSFTAPVLGDGIWYARARSSDAAGNNSAWSATITFVVDTLAPANPALIAPANGAVIAASSVTISWGAVTGAAEYVVQISQDSGLATYEEYRVTTTQKSLPLVDGTWTFRVGAGDLAGNASDILAATKRSFTIDTQAPGTPTLVQLAALINNRTPTFSWSNESAGGATSYEMQLDGVNYTTVSTSMPSPVSLTDGVHSWTVAAIDAANNKSPSATPQAFTVDATAPGAPTLTPVTPNPTRLTQPVLSFSSVSGAVTYLVEWDTVTTFNSGNHGIRTLSATSTQPTTALADGTWHWRVSATDEAGNTSAFSAVDGFVIDTAGPADPVLTAPVSGAKMASSAVTFVWSAIGDAVSYRLQTATDSSFTAPSVESNLTSTTKAVVLGDGLYWARVIAVDAAGNVSPGSVSLSFTVDTTAPSTPVATPVASPTKNNKPTLQWSDCAGSGAVSYRLRLDASTLTVAAISYTPTIALTDGTHTFSAAAVDDAGNISAYSAAQVFEVDATPPQAPVLTPVTPDPTNTTSFTLTWTPISDAVSYAVEWDTTSSFNSGNLHSAVVTTNRADIGPLTAATWYWRVSARDAATNVGPASTVDDFTIDLTPPANPTLSSPANGGYATSSTVTFVWASVADAAYYQFDISQSPTLVTYDRTQLAATSRSVALPDGTWYWRVLAQDAAGNLSAVASAPIRSVIVDTVAPAVPTLTAVASPSNNTTPTLTWGAVTGAAQYVVTLDSSTATVGVTSYTPGSALTDGTHTWTVASRDAAGNQSAAAPTQSFVIDATPPAVPTLTAYAPDPTTDNTPTVIWSASSGAATYTVEWDTVTTFNSGNLGTKTLSSTTYDLGPLGNGLWYWHVRATDAVGNNSAYSANDSFTVDTTAPAAPSPTSPANASTSTSANVTFTWSSVADAVSYRLQLGSDVGLNTILFDVAGIAVTSKALTLSDTTYYWRVLATDAAGNQTTPGSATVWSLTVDATAPGKPTLATVTTPTNDATPTFTWSDESASGAVQYVMTIDSTDTTLAATTYTPASNLADGTHTAKVRSRDSAGNPSPYSDTQTFVVDTSIPTTPGSLVPAANAVLLSTSVGFSWGVATDSVTAVTYTLQVARASDFASLVVNQSQTGTSATVTLADNDYWWRVRAVDAAGNPGAWAPGAAGQKVTVDTTPPSRPVLTAVGALVNAAPTLIWSDESASGATSYDVQVDSESGFNAPITVDTNVATASCAPATCTSSLADGTWYWRVRARDANTNVSAWTAYDTFVLDKTPPGPPTSPVPIAGYQTNSTSITFSWTAPTGATRYRLEIAYDSGFSAIYQQVSTAATSVALTFPDGVYYWRVYALDAAGNQSSAAGSTSFTVDRTAPTRPTALMIPSWVNVAQANVTIGWSDEAGSGAVGYDFQIASNSTFVTVVDSGSTVSTSVSRARPSPDGTYYWHVRALDSLSNASLWSATQSFGVDTVAPPKPALSSPANLAYLNASVASVDLQWNSVTDASPFQATPVLYRLQIGLEATFTNQVVVDATQAGLTSSQSLSEGHYYWRVRAIDSAGNVGTYTGADNREFTIDRTAPGTPSMLPYPTMTADNSPNLAWTTVSDALLYVVVIDDTNDFSSPLQTITVASPRTGLLDTDFTGNVPNVLVYARVTARDAAGNNSAPSSVISFTVDSLPPFAPAMCELAQVPPIQYGGVAPDYNEGAYSDSTPPFRWSAVTDASTFKMEAYRNTGGTTWALRNTVVGIPTNGTFQVNYNWPDSLALTDGELYYFLVYAVDAAGNTSPSILCSIIPGVRFYLRSDQSAPSAVSGLSVSTTSPTNGTTVAFSWNKMQDTLNRGEMGYTLQLLAADGVTVLDSKSIAWSTSYVGGTRSSSFSSLPPNTSAYVQVSAWDAAQNVGSAAKSAAIVQDNIAPRAPILQSPLAASGGVKRLNSLMPTLYWSNESSTGATSYTLYVYNSNSSGTKLTQERSVSGIATTSYTLASPLAQSYFLWEIVALDAAGNTATGAAGPANEQGWFQTDTTAPNPVANLVKPNNSANVNASGLLFQFSQSSSADPRIYKLQVLDSGSNVAYEKMCALASGSACIAYPPPSGTNAQINAIGTALDAGAYTWKVQVLDDLGNASAWSPVWSFTYDVLPPNIPRLLSPADGTYRNTTSVPLSWTNESASGAMQYKISVEYWAGASWTAVAGYPKTVAIASETANLASTGEKLYQFYVRSVDAAGNESGDSAPWKFTIDTQPPNAVQNLSLTAQSRQLYASWSSVSDNGLAGIDYYEVQYGADSTWASYSTLNAYTTQVAIEGLENRRQYFARVRAVDKAGNPGSFGPTASASTGVRQAFVKTDPLTDRVMSSPQIWYGDGTLYVTGIQTRSLGGHYITIYGCTAASKDCRLSINWTKLLISASGNSVTSMEPVPLVVTNKYLMMAALEKDASSNIYAPVALVCDRVANDCLASSSYWTAVPLETYASTISSLSIAMTASTSMVTVGYYVNVAANDNRPRVRSCHSTADCTLPASWLATTGTLDETAVNPVSGSQLALAASDDYVWALYRAPTGIRVERCAATSACDASTDWLYPHYVTGTDTGTYWSTSAVATKSRLYAAFAGDDHVQYIAMCSFSSGCDATADWTRGTLLSSGEVGSYTYRQLVRLSYGANELHAVWWSRESSQVWYGWCPTPESTDCTVTANWRKLVMDPWILDDTKPSAVAFDSNIAAVWMDDDMKLKLSMPIVTSPLKFAAGPSVSSARADWNALEGLGGYDLLYDTDGGPAWLNQSVIADPLQTRASISATNGTDYYLALQGFNDEGEVSDETQTIRVRPFRIGSELTAVDDNQVPYANWAYYVATMSTDGSKSYVASARGGNLYLDQCSTATGCDVAGEWTSVMALDRLQSLYPTRIVATATRVYIVMYDSIQQTVLSWCDVSSGCDQLADFSAFNVVTTGSSMPDLAVSSANVWVATRRNADDYVLLHHCAIAADCTNSANWVRDVVVAAVAAPRGHAVVATTSYTSLVTATDTSLNYYVCAVSGLCDATGDFWAATILSRTSPSNLAPEGESLHLTLVNGTKPMFVASWDGKVQAGICVYANPYYCDSSNMWGLVTLGDIDITSPWTIDIGSYGTRAYVTIGSHWGVSFAAADQNYGFKDWWRIGGTYRNADFAKPGSNRSVMAVSPGPGGVGVPSLISTGVAVKPSSSIRPQILFDGALDPR